MLRKRFGTTKVFNQAQYLSTTSPIKLQSESQPIIITEMQYEEEQNMKTPPKNTLQKGLRDYDNLNEKSPESVEKSKITISRPKTSEGTRSPFLKLQKLQEYSQNPLFSKSRFHDWKVQNRQKQENNEESRSQLLDDADIVSQFFEKRGQEKPRTATAQSCKSCKVMDILRCQKVKEPGYLECKV